MTSNPSEEAKPFLAFDEEPHTKHQRTWPSRSMILVHLTLIAIYTATSVLVIRTRTHLSPLALQASPLTDIHLTHRATLLKNLTANPYAGAPSPAIDAAWDALLAPVNMRVTSHELARQGGSSVALGEGGGYLAWLGAFHEIHCIKMLRQWNYREYYHANISADETVHWASHADHCFEMLRQAAVCHADVSLTTFVWDETKAKPMFDARETRRTCVDWEALMGSTAKRVVSDEEIGRLVNPLTGSTP